MLVSGAAHSPQKLASATFSTPQAVHRMDGLSGTASTLDPLARRIQATGAHSTSPDTPEVLRLDRKIRRTVVPETPTALAIARPEESREAISMTFWTWTKAAYARASCRVGARPEGLTKVVSRAKRREHPARLRWRLAVDDRFIP